MLRFRAVPRLVYKEPSGSEVVVGLRDKDVTIGRQADCELVVSSASTSRKHAKVSRRGARWVLSDLGSSHGTTINGGRLEGEHTLKIGDEILMGEALVVFDEGHAPVEAKGGASPIAPRTPAPNPGLILSGGEPPTGSLDLDSVKKRRAAPPPPPQNRR